MRMQPMLIGLTHDCADSWCWYMQLEYPRVTKCHFFLGQKETALCDNLVYHGLNRCFGSLRLIGSGQVLHGLWGCQGCLCQALQRLGVEVYFPWQWTWLQYFYMLLTFNMFDVPPFSLAKWPLFDKRILTRVNSEQRHIQSGCAGIVARLPIWHPKRRSRRSKYLYCKICNM